MDSILHLHSLFTKVTFSFVRKECPELHVVPDGDESTDEDDENCSTHLFERTVNFT